MALGRLICATGCDDDAKMHWLEGMPPPAWSLEKQ